MKINDVRKILCVTGTRADYPRVKSVLKEIKNRNNLKLQLVVTGSHLLEEFGYTVKEIEDDGIDDTDEEQEVVNYVLPYVYQPITNFEIKQTKKN